VYRFYELDLPKRGQHEYDFEKNPQHFSEQDIQEYHIVSTVFIVENDTNHTLVSLEKSMPTEEIKLAETNSSKKRITDLSIENLVVNNVIVLEHILFYAGSERLYPESFPHLEELRNVMQKHETLKIEIHGHICCTDDDPTDLSGRRAKQIYDYLVKYGIDAERLTHKGFGTTRKLYPLEENVSEKRLNRRVEILILEI
jgi:outer membrane protein OmpA-like peptidoglycan-associated protein